MEQAHRHEAPKWSSLKDRPNKKRVIGWFELIINQNTPVCCSLLLWQQVAQGDCRLYTLLFWWISPQQWLFMFVLLCTLNMEVKPARGQFNDWRGIDKDEVWHGTLKVTTMWNYIWVNRDKRGGVISPDWGEIRGCISWLLELNFITEYMQDDERCSSLFVCLWSCRSNESYWGKKSKQWKFPHCVSSRNTIPMACLTSAMLEWSHMALCTLLSALFFSFEILLRAHRKELLINQSKDRHRV